MGFHLHCGFKINNYRFTSEKLRRDIRFVMFSDLHECTHGKGNAGIFAAVRRIRPDFIAIAGDMVDAERIGNCEEVMKLLRALAEEFPVYFGVGNHERFLLNDNKKLPAQKERFKRGLEGSALKLMRNESELLEDANICITGLDLPLWYYRKTFLELLDVENLEVFIGKADTDKFNILLAHDPDHFKAYAGWGADLVLSGHVHGGIVGLGGNRGLISPKIRLFPRFCAGRYVLGSASMLVSRGLGNHTINFRLNNPPEMMVVELNNNI